MTSKFSRHFIRVDCGPMIAVSAVAPRVSRIEYMELGVRPRTLSHKNADANRGTLLHVSSGATVENGLRQRCGVPINSKSALGTRPSERESGRRIDSSGDIAGSP